MDKVTEDDGSLSFLNIKRDENNRSFNCGETTQSQIVNTTFWVVDFLEDVPTRFSKAKGTKGQTLVKIKPERDSPEKDAKKFFLKKIKEMDKFPRKVTLRGSNNRYYFE